MERNYSVNISLAFLLSMSFCVYAVLTCCGSVVHDVAVVDVAVYPTKVLAGAAVTINAKVENQGTSYESFNVTAYFNNHTVQTLTVNQLAPGLNTTLTFEWSIFPSRLQIFPPPWRQGEIMIKNCTIKVEADVIPGEIDIFDNVHVNGTVTVIWWCVDLNGDGKINIIDVTIIAKAFGRGSWHPLWDPAWDIHRDGYIDIRDLAMIAVNFGKDYTWMDP